MAETNNIVGNSVERKEGAAKVLGRALYVDDISLPGMWYGATVRSPIARGRILSIDFRPGINWDEFVIVTAKDIPGENCIIHLTKDQPCLADGLVNHPDEPILLLAHPHRASLPAAMAAVKIEYEPLPAVFTIEDSEKMDPVIWDDKGNGGEAPNTFKSYLMEKGDPDSVWANADFIVEGEYRTGAQEQLYIENNGVIAEVFAQRRA